MIGELAQSNFEHYTVSTRVNNGRTDEPGLSSRVAAAFVRESGNLFSR